MARMSTIKRPTLAALAIIIGLTLIFFWKILLTNLILSGVDVFLYFYPYKAYVTQALRQGQLPLWNPHLFMGAPLMANSQVGLFYPPNWFFIGLSVPKQVAWSIGLHVALAGLFMLAFARQSLGLGWPAALLAAVLFAFGGYLGAQVEHINQLQAAAWLPLLFLLYDISLRRRRWLLLLALVIALALLAGHAQTAFISLFGLGLYGLWQAITESASPKAVQLPIQNSKPPGLPRAGKIQKSKFLTHSLIHHLWPLAAAALLAAALAAIQLLPTAELSARSIRSQGLTFQEVVSFSLNPTTLHYSLLPPLGLDLTQILGEAFSEWVAYLGVSGLILALLGAFSAIWQPPARRLVFVALVGLVLSFGLFLGPLFLFDVLIGIDSELFHTLARWTHPYYALYKLVPGFALFRVPARWLLLYAFAAAALAGFGFDSLRQPNALRRRFSTARRWLAHHPKWRVALPGLPALAALTLIAWKTPPLTTLAAWLAFAALALSLIYYALRATPSSSPRSLLILTLLLELFWAAQALNYNQPTAPQAYHSMRNAVAFLLAADPPGQAAPPGRFLSLSGITYDPGDLADLRQIYGPHLSEKALYNLVVATKEKEVLFFNLPLVYNLHSVDGYDGGILPLAQFVTLQELFLSPAELSRDGRLRENLRFVPSNRLLSMLNTRWIITDKQFDAWIDGIFYDLQFPARLMPGQSIATTNIPNFPPTALGLVSHLEGAASLPTHTPVAQIIITFASGHTETLQLAAGVDTAEGDYSPQVAHAQARVGVAWPYAAGGVDYIAVQPLSSGGQVARISVESLLPFGQFVLRGVSLIHQPTTTSRSVLLSTEGNYRQVHSGDVKIYENLDVLPRAFIAHRAEIVQSDRQAIAVMQQPDFNPAQTLVRLKTDADERAGLITAGQASPQDSAAIVAYAPERVEITATLASPGWLVLADTHYPGWQAAVNGQPVEIFQANGLFRGIALPAGEHRVVFEFKPDSFKWGVVISGVALFGLLVGLVVAVKRSRINAK